MLVHHLLHAFYTAFGVAVIQQAQTLDEEELRTVLPQGEATLGKVCVGLHLSMTVSLEGIVGGSIERVLDMDAKALVLYEIGVREQHGPLALRIAGLQHSDTAIGLSGAP